MSQKTVEDVIGEGTAIAHYRVLGPLGAGGMGAVYKAHDEKLNRVVAVKILSAGAVAHEDRRRRFLQEARAASALNHPHILTVYEIGDTGGRPFIVMEYIEGETLRQKIAARSLAVRDALEIAIQIAQGLTKAHEHGIVHRDLKPENLMINRDGYAKILDFGLAKLIERKRAAAAGASAEQTIIQVNTHSGTIMGTVKYMSPEQVLGRRIDLRSDIFSFAVVLYEMLTGVPPFVRDNDIDTMHSILHDEPKPPHAVKPELPRVLHTVLARALSKEPRQRYQTISEFAAAIQSLKRDIEAGKTSAPVKTRLVLKPVSTARARAPKIDYERELNEAQYEAVMTAEGPLLIIAGAGTGKTRTLVYRVARLIETAAKPESILLLTFTRRAAQSMLGKAAALADERCQRVAGGTFHSMAHATLRRHPELAGVHRMFTVFDQSDTEDLIDLVRRQAGLTKDRHFPRKRTIAGVFSMAANKLLSVEEVVKQYYPQFVAATGDLVKLHAAFDSYKRERHLLTYDDLLTRLAEALEASEELRLKLSNQYRYIMVDEYQDTNQRQAQIVRLLAATHDNVAVVGDECQSIYAFRGANFRNMLEFPGLFPGARVIKLEENFRSTQPILDLANTLIGEASEGYSKQLFSRLSDGPAPVLVNASDENEQSRFVVQRIEELREDGVPYQEMAVLFRAGSHSFDLEIELGRHGVPFRKFGGIKFVESAHIKDLLAFLRVVVNPSDVISWCRMLKLIDHVGDATVQQILDFLGVEKKEFRTPRSRAALFQRLSQFPARASYTDQLQKLARLLQRVFEEKVVGAQLTAVERFYRPIMQSAYDDHPRRQREIEHLKSIGKRYKSAEELLADVALDPVEMALAESQARGQGYVTLSTVHSAKGLEWKALFLIWMVDGWFPSLRSYDAFEDLEEERRLLYVAATRAKEHLYFISPSTYDAGGASAYGGVSRFLEPVPETLLPRAELQ